MLWQLRPPNEQDVSFIFNSWLKSARSAPALIDIPNGPYYKYLHTGIESVLRSDNARIVVACSPKEGDEGVIFGYGVAELDDKSLILHFIYTKHTFRNFGIGKDIEIELKKTPHENVTYSCQSKLAKTLLKTRDYTYNPFSLWSKCK